MEKVFITGAAGFIGSNLVDRLLADGKTVVGYDNFSTGQNEFLEGALKNPKFQLIHGDCLDLPALTKAMTGCDFIFHFAANADVRFGLDHPGKDFQQNAQASFNVLEAMRVSGVRRITIALVELRAKGTKGVVDGLRPDMDVVVGPPGNELRGRCQRLGEGHHQPTGGDDQDSAP